MREQLEHLIRVNEKLPNVAVHVLPLGSGSHPFLGFTNTLHSFPKPAPDVITTGGPSRDLFYDRPQVVARIAADFRLLRAKALGVGDSTEYLRALLELLADP